MRWDDGAVAGVDMVDQDLDVRGRTRTAAWQWKDEDEFAERLAFPEHYWVTDEAAVRAEGERVIKLAEAGEFPFDGTWCDFTPPRTGPCRTSCRPAGTARRCADRVALGRHVPGPPPGVACPRSGVRVPVPDLAEWSLVSGARPAPSNPGASPVHRAVSGPNPTVPVGAHPSHRPYRAGEIATGAKQLWP